MKDFECDTKMSHLIVNLTFRVEELKRASAEIKFSSLSFKVTTHFYFSVTTLPRYA